MDEAALTFVYGVFHDLGPRRFVLEVGPEGHAPELDGSKWAANDLSDERSAKLRAQWVERKQFAEGFEPDTIVCAGVLERVAAPLALVLTAQRALAPGGVLVVVTRDPVASGDLRNWLMAFDRCHVEESGGQVFGVAWKATGL